MCRNHSHVKADLVLFEVGQSGALAIAETEHDITLEMSIGVPLKLATSKGVLLLLLPQGAPSSWGLRLMEELITSAYAGESFASELGATHPKK